MAELVCMKIHGVTVAEYKQRQAEQAAAQAAEKAAQQQAAEQQQPQAATAGGFANSVYNPANQNDFSSGFGSSNPPPMPSSFSSSASNQDDYHENVVKVDFSRPSTSNESNQQVQSEVIESKIAVGAEGQQVWSNPSTTNQNGGAWASANGSGGGSGNGSQANTQAQAPGFSANSGGQSSGSFGGGNSNAGQQSWVQSPTPGASDNDHSISRALERDENPNVGGSLGRYSDNKEAHREYTQQKTAELQQEFPYVQFTEKFGTDQARYDQNGNITGFPGPMHPDKHFCQDVKDVVNHVINVFGKRGFERDVTHSFYATAEAANIAREVSLRAASTKMQGELAKAGLAGRSPIVIDGFIDRDSYSPAQLAVMERDGFGRAVKAVAFANSSEPLATVTAHAGIETHLYKFVPAQDPVSGQWFYRETTGYPEFKGKPEVTAPFWEQTKRTEFTACDIKKPKK
jgi:hypothetical protein